MINKKYKGSIFVSLVVFTAIIIILNCFIMLFINVFFTNTYYMNDLKNYMEEQNQEIINNYYNIESYDAKYKIYNMRLEQYDTQKNEIIYSSQTKRKSMPISQKLTTEEINEIFDNILGDQSFIIIEPENESYIILDSLIENNEDQIIMLSKQRENNYFILEIPAPAIVNASNLLRNYVLLTSFIGMLILIPVIIIFSYMFTKPIKEIYKTTNRIKELDFSKQCSVNSKNELGLLAENINNMSNTIQGYINEINAKNVMLEKDIELKTKLDDSQKKFISDVSHEFKTPISIISVYAEGIKVGMVDTPEGIEEYCNIIMSECERMTAITQRLLYLSKLESNTYKLNITRFDITELVKEDIGRFELKCSQSGIAIQNLLPDKKMYVEADMAEIEKVIMNYLSNAYKYCGKPGIIKISISDEGDCYKLAVYNNGQQIKDPDKIWNRFYKEDKARTRNENSTGLGLSIVKAAMELHKMPYGFNNKDSGVEFYIGIKKHKKNK